MFFINIQYAPLAMYKREDILNPIWNWLLLSSNDKLKRIRTCAEKCQELLPILLICSEYIDITKAPINVKSTFSWLLHHCSIPSCDLTIFLHRSSHSDTHVQSKLQPFTGKGRCKHPGSSGACSTPTRLLENGSQIRWRRRGTAPDWSKRRTSTTPADLRTVL